MIKVLKRKRFIFNLVKRLRAEQMTLPLLQGNWVFFCCLLYLGLRGINLAPDNTTYFQSSVSQCARILCEMTHICDWDFDWLWNSWFFSSKLVHFASGFISPALFSRIPPFHIGFFCNKTWFVILNVEIWPLAQAHNPQIAALVFSCWVNLQQWMSADSLVELRSIKWLQKLLF